jgi:hypothetical protein
MRLPDLKALGFGRHFKEASKLIDEIHSLSQRASELGNERMRLQEEIGQLEQQRTTAWAAAIRNAEEAPSEEDIERAKKRLKVVLQEAAAVERAAYDADAELSSVIAARREEWDRVLQAQAEKKLEEAQRIAHALSEKLAEVDPLVGVHGWLNGPEHLRGYGPPPPATIPIDGLIHERMRELGLLQTVEAIG